LIRHGIGLGSVKISFGGVSGPVAASLITRRFFSHFFRWILLRRGTCQRGTCKSAYCQFQFCPQCISMESLTPTWLFRWAYISTKYLGPTRHVFGLRRCPLLYISLSLLTRHVYGLWRCLRWCLLLHTVRLRSLRRCPFYFGGVSHGFGLRRGLTRFG
jgi:hypothetical protein